MAFGFEPDTHEVMARSAAKRIQKRFRALRREVAAGSCTMALATLTELAQFVGAYGENLYTSGAPSGSPRARASAKAWRITDAAQRIFAARCLPKKRRK